MDAVDRQLISILRGNARASYAELGRRVGLSAPAVHERVAKLESSGVITGYHAAVEPAAVGLGVTALVGVIQGPTRGEHDVVDALREMPEIEDCWFVAGEESYLLKLRVTDMAALERTIGAISRVSGVARTRTTIVLSSRWEARIGVAEADRDVPGDAGADRAGGGPNDTRPDDTGPNDTGPADPA